jgi:NAD(P)-dependent dehydrogenase (short-subunit alcohol dehydrogenase family)
MHYQKWLDKNIADLTGKIILVTGANSGLGFFTSLQLAYRGAHILMACRDAAKAHIAIQKILAIIPKAQLTYVPYDQGSIQGIYTFVDYMKHHHPRVDILVLNAGIIMPKQQAKTPDGFPLTTGVNFIHIYVLLREWLGFLDQRQKEVKVIFVGSFSAYSASLKSYKELLNHDLSRMNQYRKSKLALAFMHHVLHMNLNLFDFPVLDHVHSLLAHPGICATNITHSLPRWLASLINGYLKLVSHSAESGALSITFAAGHAYTVNGSYYGPSGPGQRFGFPTKLSIPKHLSVGSAQLTYDLGKYLKKEHPYVRSE